MIKHTYKVICNQLMQLVLIKQQRMSSGGVHHQSFYFTLDEAQQVRNDLDRAILEHHAMDAARSNAEQRPVIGLPNPNHFSDAA